MFRPSLASVVLWVCFVLHGCAEIPATNPYDPDTPTAQQARGTISGKLVVPEGFLNESVFDDLSVTLVAASADEVAPRLASVNEIGQFLFSEVPAGTYQLLVSIAAFEPVSELITLERGRTLSLENIFLTSRDLANAPQRQWVRGRVELTGRDDEDQSDVSVSVVGAPYQTQSTQEGLFELEVPAGSYTLRLTHPDYSELRIPDVVVSEGQDTELGVQVLTPFAGEISVRLNVQPNWIPVDQRYAYMNVERLGGGFSARNLLLQHQ